MAAPTLNDEATKALMEANAIAAEGKLRESTQIIKNAIQQGHLSKAIHRQIVDAWGKQKFNWPFVVDTPVPVADKFRGHEERVTKLVKERGWTHKKALEFIESGQLDAEEHHRATDPTEQMFAKMKENGPPEWFTKMLESHEGKSEGSDPAAASNEPHDSAIAEASSAPQDGARATETSCSTGAIPPRDSGVATEAS